MEHTPDTSATTPDTGDRNPENFKNAFTQENIESFRTRQKEAYDTWYNRSLDPDSDEDADEASMTATMADLTTRHLESVGMKPEDDDYDRYFGTLRSLSYDALSDTSWRYGDWTDDDHTTLGPTGPTILRAKQVELFGAEITDDTVPGPTPEEIDEAYQMNDELDAERAAAQAEREATLAEAIEKRDAAQKATELAFADRMKARFWEKRNAQEVLDQSRADLDAATREAEAAQIAVWKATGQSDEQIAQGLASRGDARANDRVAGRHQALVDSTRFGKAFETFANLPRGKKLLVKLGIGALVAAGAVFATATFGIGGSVVAAGGAAVSRGYRAYTLRRADMYGSPADDPDAPEPEKIAYKNADGSLRSHDEIIDDAQRRDNEILDDQLERGDQIKRRAFYIAAGSVALGGVMLYVEQAVDAGAGGSDKPSASAQPVKAEVTPGAPAPAPETGHEPVPTVGGGTGHEPVPTLDSTGHESVPTVTGSETVAEAVRIVKPGEGWYQTFAEMGIKNAHDQAALLNDDILMGKLANMNLAYADQSVGGWGIRMTPDGRMPQAAIDLINQRAAQNGYALVG